jgi:hypothetical protein
MTAVATKEIFRHGRDRNFTKDEYFALSDELFEAIENEDRETCERLSAILPANPEVIRIFKNVYGKDYILALGFDLTEANLLYGEGWLDEPQ